MVHPNSQLLGNGRGHSGSTSNIGLVLQNRLTGAESDDARGEHRTAHDSTLLLALDHRRLPTVARRIASEEDVQEPEPCALWLWRS
jgi:hypothetical protein